MAVVGFNRETLVYFGTSLGFSRAFPSVCHFLSCAILLPSTTWILANLQYLFSIKIMSNYICILNFLPWNFLCRMHKHCRKTISHACRALFEDPERPIATIPDHNTATIVEEFVPPMPFKEGDKQPLFSNWAMHEIRFKQFSTFAKMFLTTLEATFQVRKNMANCPLYIVPPHSPGFCWCFMMERIVNIWAQHAGIRMLHVNVDDGTITEKRQMSEVEQSYRWQQYFLEENIYHLSQTFRARLDKDALEIYDGFNATRT